MPHTNSFIRQIPLFVASLLSGAHRQIHLDNGYAFNILMYNYFFSRFMKQRHVLLMALLVICTLSAFAQQTVTGYVFTADDREPVLGATVMATGTKITPVRVKDLPRIVPIAYSFQCALAVPRAYSRRNSMQPMPHRDS